MRHYEKMGFKEPSEFVRMRWLMWLFLVSLHLVTSFHRVSFNVVADLLTAEFNLTGAGLGNLAAAYTYMYVIMQIPGGMLVDRLRPRQMALLTGAAMACGSIVIALAPSAAFVFVGRLLIGLGGSVVLINIFKFQASWFRSTEFATLSGFALLISSSGALMAATPLALSVNLIGWRGSFLAVGIVTVLLAILGWVFIRSSPSDFKLGEQLADYLPEKIVLPDKALHPTLKTVLRLFLNRRIWPPFLINLGTFGGFFVFSGTWGVSYLVHVYGFTVEQASSMMMIAYLGYMIGAPTAGALSDRLGSRRIPALALASCCVVFWLTLAAWPDGLLPVGLLYVLAAMLGFGGACSVLSFPMAREASPPGLTGSVTAMVNLGAFLGLAILQPLTGFVLDLGWGGLLTEGARIYPLQAYRLGFAVPLIFAFISLAAALSYRDQDRLEQGG